MRQRLTTMLALAMLVVALGASPAMAETISVTAPSTAEVGQEVSARVTVGDVTLVASWTIDWGDGSNQVILSVAGTFTETHVYSSPGTYTISVEAEGATDSTMISIEGYDGTFADDDGSVFEADIEWLAAEEITRGCNPPDNTLFCPSQIVTRGEMAAFLVRALGYTDTGTASFTDTAGSIFETDILKLATADVTRGCNPPDNDMFCPDAPVTRGQMAAFLVRALGYTDTGTASFTDTAGSIFETDILKLATADVTRGCNPPTNDRYCPTDGVTRGQMAAFLHRALG
jgi:hypothetical protein